MERTKVRAIQVNDDKPRPKPSGLDWMTDAAWKRLEALPPSVCATLLVYTDPDGSQWFSVSWTPREGAPPTVSQQYFADKASATTIASIVAGIKAA